jgi:tRNA uridine 5-carboxymethylaminomethyl modification enzyme
VRYTALASLLGADLGDSISLSELAKRQGVGPELIKSLLPSPLNSEISDSDLTSVLADSLYEGYLATQKLNINKLFQHDSLRIPSGASFTGVSGLSHEIVERLHRARPATFGEARNIPGLTPAALSTLLVYLSANQRKASN